MSQCPNCRTHNTAAICMVCEVCRAQWTEYPPQMPPREPTAEMLAAGYRAFGNRLYMPVDAAMKGSALSIVEQGWGESAKAIYQAMYDAYRAVSLHVQAPDV